MDIIALKAWFLENKRALPWRENASPYSIWVSEMMLQQTQANVVIPYFLKWMEHYPDIRSLAQAEEKEVLKLWEGLGYYSRARNLHQGAKEIFKNFNGVLPSSKGELAQIKGIGPYTSGAILSFAFHLRAAAVDGNVARVLSRLLLIEEDITKHAIRKKLEAYINTILPMREPWIVMEGIIELGALICQKKPKCFLCPLKADCLAYQNGKESSLPHRKKTHFISLVRKVFICIHRKKVLIRLVPQGEVMAGLNEFPYSDEGTSGSITDCINKNAKKIAKLKQVRHSFTRYRVLLFAEIWECNEPFFLDGYRWTDLQLIKELPFSSGHKKLIKQCESNEYFTH